MTKETIRIRRQRFFTPNNSHFRDFVHRIVVATRQTTCIVHLRIGRSQNITCTGDSWRIARIATLGITCIGCAKHAMGIRTTHGATLTSCSTKNGYGFCAVLLLNFGDLFGNQIEGLIIGNALPLILTAVFGIPFHRIENATRVIHSVGQSKTADAKPSLSDGVVFVSFDLFDNAILVHVQLHATAHRMTAGGRICGSTSNGIFPVLVLPRLANVVLELHTLLLLNLTHLSLA